MKKTFSRFVVVKIKFGQNITLLDGFHAIRYKSFVAKTYHLAADKIDIQSVRRKFNTTMAKPKNKDLVNLKKIWRVFNMQTGDHPSILQIQQ